MPELPEVEALADHLRRRAVGRTVHRVDVASLSVLKTFDPPVTALHGRQVTGAHRWGKYLGMQSGDLYLITHLSRAGWLRWSDRLGAAPPAGQGTDRAAGSSRRRRRLRPHRSRYAEAAGGVAGGDPNDVPGIAKLGPICWRSLHSSSRMCWGQLRRIRP